MAKYLLQQFTPDQLNIDFKQNNQRLNISEQILSGAVSDILAEELPLQNKHLITTKDYQLLQNRLFQLIKYLTLLITYNKGYFDTFWQNIDVNIRKLIQKVFIRVIKYNGKSISGNVIESVKINNKTKRYRKYNKGVIDLGDNYITSGAYVNTYNNLDKDVYGISGVILNDKIHWPDLTGNVEITGLVPKDTTLVNTFNNSAGKINGVISAVTSSNITNYITYNNVNKGIINVNDIITTYIDANLYASRIDAILTNCSADSITDINDLYLYPNRVATKQTLDMSLSKMLGFNNIKIQQALWTKVSDDLYSYNVTVISGHQFLNIYKQNDFNFSNYHLMFNNTESNGILSCNINLSEQNITIDSPWPFIGYITVLQDIEPVQFIITPNVNTNPSFFYIQGIQSNPTSNGNIIFPATYTSGDIITGAVYAGQYIQALNAIRLQINNSYTSLARSSINSLFINPEIYRTNNSKEIKGTVRLEGNDRINKVIFSERNNLGYFHAWGAWIKQCIVPLRSDLRLNLDGKGRYYNTQSGWIVNFDEHERTVENNWLVVTETPENLINPDIPTITSLIQTIPERTYSGQLSSFNIPGFSGLVTFSCACGQSIEEQNNILLPTWRFSRGLSSLVTSLIIDSDFRVNHPVYKKINGNIISTIQEDFFDYDYENKRLSCTDICELGLGELSLDIFKYNATPDKIKSYSEFYPNNMYIKYNDQNLKSQNLNNYLGTYWRNFAYYDDSDNLYTVITPSFSEFFMSGYIGINNNWVYWNSSNTYPGLADLRVYIKRNDSYSKGTNIDIDCNGQIIIPSSVILNDNNDLMEISTRCAVNGINMVFRNSNRPLSCTINCSKMGFTIGDGVKTQFYIVENNARIVFKYGKTFNLINPQLAYIPICFLRSMQAGSIDFYFERNNGSYEHITYDESNPIKWLNNNIGFCKTTNNSNKYGGFLIYKDNENKNHLIQISDHSLIFDQNNDEITYTTNLYNAIQRCNINQLNGGSFYLLQDKLNYKFPSCVTVLNRSCIYGCYINTLIFEANKLTLTENCIMNTGINELKIYATDLTISPKWYIKHSGDGEGTDLKIIRIKYKNYPSGTLINDKIEKDEKLKYLISDNSQRRVYAL